ncbi:hypothetical protein BH10ACI3_BH10ACI3_27500 [soil metagenome]
MMAKRLTMLMVILALAAGVLAGTPLHDPNDGMMECCKRARSKEHSKAAEVSRLCCAMNCSTSSPIPSGSSFNPAPTNIAISSSIADQIAALFAKEKATPMSATAYSREVLPRTFQPSYIQHHSFLI